MKVRSSRTLAGVTKRLARRITSDTIAPRARRGAPMRQIGAPDAVITISSLSPFIRSSV
jgi:hypothetical protein